MEYMMNTYQYLAVGKGEQKEMVMVKLGCKMNGCSQVEFMHNKIVQINSHLSPALNNPIF